MATQSKLKPTPIIYAIGDDLSPDVYNQLVQGVGDWFSETRNTKEPVKLAKQVIDACLKCVKPSDPAQIWESAATATLEKRIRMACRFDMVTMQPLRSADEKTKAKKEKAKDRERKKRDEAKVDQHYPEEFKNATAMDPTYGDDPAVFFTSKELETRAARRDAMIIQFPQLDNVAQEPKLDMLLDLQLLFDRMRFRNAAAGANKKEVRASEQEMQDLTKRIVDLEKAMGIDPVSVNKMQKEKEGGTIGDAVARFEQLGDYRAIKERLLAEELLMAFEMYHQPSPRPDMEGWQLDDVGLYGLTKTRVVTCPKCGERNFAGFSIEEIEAWLVAKGHLKPLPPLPVEPEADAPAVAHKAAE